MRTRLDWWQARADDVAVGLLTAMFLAFVLQITARYVVNYPLPWTLVMDRLLGFGLVLAPPGPHQL